jgi:hypothetical protein
MQVSIDELSGDGIHAPGSPASRHEKGCMTGPHSQRGPFSVAVWLRTSRFARKTAGTQLSPGTLPDRYDLALQCWITGPISISSSGYAIPCAWDCAPAGNRADAGER